MKKTADSGKSILDFIGQTPLVALGRVGPARPRLFAKLECGNPSGSVKDRTALAMIRAAEQAGRIGSGGTIVLSSTGNMGISAGLVASVRGYRCVIAVPETMPAERRSLLKTLGAELVLTSASGGMRGAADTAVQIAESEKNCCLLDPFNDPANAEAHRGTADEIGEIVGAEIAYLVAGVGTGGTLVGSGLRLRERHPKLKVVAVEPRASAVLSGGEAGSHAIMGIGPGFVPPHLDAIDIDEVIAVSDEEAVSTCRRLFSEEGLMAGVSSGAAAFAAIALSQRGGAGGPIVTIFPDRGERYFESRLIL